MKGPRIRCEDVGCRRTANADHYPQGTLIVCGKCWRMAPRALRLEHAAARRSVTKAEARAAHHDRQGWPQFACAHDRLIFAEAVLRADHLWTEVMAVINEARGGLA